MEKTIIDNFLSKDEFNNLLPIMQNKFPWEFHQKLNNKHISIENDHKYYFHHTFYYGDYVSNFFNLVGPLWNKLNINACVRIKGNCYPSTQQLVEHDAHIDFDFKHKGAILYLNTNDGYTKLSDGSIVESVKNRLLIFDPTLPHSSTNCTDQKARFNININYF
jgi:hypothetical protein